MKWICILFLIPALALGQNDAYPKSDANLVAWYKLDGNFKDEISGSSGSAVGNVVSIGGKRGSGAYQVGANYGDIYISLVNSTLLNNKTQYTISLWVWVFNTPQGNDGVLVFRGSGGDAAKMYGFAQNAGAGAAFGAWVNGASYNAYSLPITFSQSIFRWTHITMVYDGYYIITYVVDESGPIQTYRTNHGAVTVFQNQSILLLADSYDVHNWCLPGGVDDVMIWDRALTANEVTLLRTSRYRQTLGQITEITSGQGLGIGD